MICQRAGINVWDLINLANKHPRVNILQPGCGVGGHCIAVDPYFITAAFPEEAQIIAKAREINNYKSAWCEERVKNAILEYKLQNAKNPVVALMGLAFKPNIDDLRESPSKRIAQQLVLEINDVDFRIVEPNIDRHPDFTISDYQKAFAEADIVVYLTAHKQFFELPQQSDKVILDFCGVVK